MKRILPLVLLVAALAVWALWPDPHPRAASEHLPIDREPAQPERTDAPFIDPEVERREESGVACLEGVVSGPDGTIWNARVRVHRAGDEVAFDETGTSMDGRYKLEFGVRADGEDFDVEFLPPKGAALRTQRLDGVHLAPGAALQRDVTLEPGEVLVGSVVGLANRGFDRGVQIVAIDYADWERVRAGGHPTWQQLGRLARGRARATPGFRFTELAPGTYALVCASREYEVLDPVPVSPGGAPARVVLTRVTTVHVAAHDASTGGPAKNVEVRVEGAAKDEPLSVARGSGTFLARLRWKRFDRGEPRALRLRAPGYHELRLEQAHWSPFSTNLRIGFVPLDARKLTLRAGGAGGELFAANVELHLRRPVERGARVQHVRAPVLERAADRVVFAMPAGSWTVALLGEGLSLPAFTPLVLEGSKERDQELAFVIESPGSLEFDWSALGRGSPLNIWATGPKLEWRQGEDGAYRLAEVAATGGGFALVGQNWDRRTLPERVPIPGGVWTIHWMIQSPEGSQRQSRVVSVAAGQTSLLAIRR